MDIEKVDFYKMMSLAYIKNNEVSIRQYAKQISLILTSIDSQSEIIKSNQKEVNNIIWSDVLLPYDLVKRCERLLLYTYFICSEGLPSNILLTIAKLCNEFAELCSNSRMKTISNDIQRIKDKKNDTEI